MKKIIFIGLLSVLVVMIFFPGAAFCGESAYIPISISIPAIPGINAPIIEVKKETQALNNAEQKTNNITQKIPQDGNIVAQKQGKKIEKYEAVFFLTETHTPAGGIVQTIYSR